MRLEITDNQMIVVKEATSSSSYTPIQTKVNVHTWSNSARDL